MRQLLGPPGSHGGAHADDHAAESNLDLRIASLVFIFAASMLGALPPVFLLRRRGSGRAAPLDSDAVRVLQAFAGSTIAALAVVHVAPVAVETLAAMPLTVPFDHLGGAVVLVGLLLTVSLDGLIAARAAPEPYKWALRQALGLPQPPQKPSSAADASNAKSGAAGEKAEGGVLAAVVVATTVPATTLGQAGGAAASAAEENSLPARPHHHQHICSRALSEHRLAVALAASAAAEGDGGEDGGDGARPTSTLAALVQRDERRAAALAYSLEVGCVLHSLLIGAAIGVSAAAPRSAVAALSAAVAVHQLVEGVALGCALARAPFSRARCASMALFYSLTTPAGVALGIGIALTAFDQDSVAALAVTGVFSGLSAGLLLYLGLCQLLMEELSRDDLIVRPKMRYACHGAALLGGALMCVLALWA